MRYLFFWVTMFFTLHQAHTQTTWPVEELTPPDYISTLQFKGGTQLSQLPIIELGGTLYFSFDDLNGNEADYYYTITHYNFDWTPSDLSKGEYLDGFDDVRIETYENSENTLQLFSHYRLQIPNRETRALTKSGNYLIKIFNDDGNLVFSRKFMVVERLAGVRVQIKRARKLDAIEHQQVVQFSVVSPGFQIINPKQNLHTLVLQNSNLKTAIHNLKPQYTLGKEFIYRYDTEAAFWGGNEFRAFDNKDIRVAGNGIQYVARNELYENFLFPDFDRSNRPYTYNPDVNGNFVVRNINADNQDLRAEYVWVHFELKIPKLPEFEEVHLYGNFNNWEVNASTQLIYNAETQSYQLSRRFKQGFYNYKYAVRKVDGTLDAGRLSGNHWQTENDYTVLVYYRHPGARFDRIIGVGTQNATTITSN